MKAYETVYETIEDNEDRGGIQYIKLYNVGQKVVTRNCKGYLPSQVAFYLQVRVLRVVVVVVVVMVVVVVVAPVDFAYCLHAQQDDLPPFHENTLKLRTT